MDGLRITNHRYGGCGRFGERRNAGARMNLTYRLINDNGRLTTCQVVLGPSGTILYGLATRLLQLFAHHDHHIFFASCVCV